jgi:hypothetical protein
MKMTNLSDVDVRNILEKCESIFDALFEIENGSPDDMDEDIYETLERLLPVIGNATSDIKNIVKSKRLERKQ